MAYSLPTPFTPNNSEFAALDPSRVPDGTISITALARFEFEAGKGNDGTKILMIEWEDDDLNRTGPSTDNNNNTKGGGSWHVAWEGKQAVLPADEKTKDNTRRFYFLLPPHVTIPPTVTLFYEAAPADHDQNTAAAAAATTGKAPEPLHLNPLPAIFPPELGADGRSAGKKGVLHTIWAKKRLQVLDKEIRDECLANVEGIALHMALQEKEWIETNFGVSLTERSPPASHPDPHYPMGPATPVSPSTTGGGKLGEKLRGLKLQTGEKELSPKGEGHAATARHLLSPQSPDVAVSSFTSFHTLHSNTNNNTTTTNNNNKHQPTQPPSDPPTRPIIVHYPPESLQTHQSPDSHHQHHLQQNHQHHLHHTGFTSIGSLTHTHPSSAESGEELFAKALSPRTPDLPRSPFSFSPGTLHM
ncbi:uncharacterized protein BO72DRAFT_2455 [Aspergillus fijiensis CBS 313.89]|uniref:Uncharacterized protein n=1 Tax=Aspergillus fijiensis CBS 313.89 TaxID=1448319 RepID=A0A8G1W3M0_9EURO|nr:uncharacterized protein BO72DRAFT_2455 [Aspergillus fijiensis CBS 313.89]RAK82592.1 hypothetical protein BO72DRAFT_2455 [Aspergillus fijiensis CBS 313.89]